MPWQYLMGFLLLVLGKNSLTQKNVCIDDLYEKMLLMQTMEEYFDGYDDALLVAILTWTAPVVKLLVAALKN